MVLELLMARAWWQSGQQESQKSDDAGVEPTERV